MKEYSRLKITTFRERFSDLCESNPMSDTALAEKLHVSKQTVSAWRNGTRSPKEPTVIAIANHFGVNVAWLLGFDVGKFPEDEKPEPKDAGNFPQTEEARTLARGIDKLPQEQREQALNVIKAMFSQYADYFEKETTDET